MGNDRPDGNFFARAVAARRTGTRPWMAPIERVVLVHRLREVVAQVGFTRFEAAAPDIEGELEMGVRRAALAREITWLPAVENQGEGIFLQFKQAADRGVAATAGRPGARPAADGRLRLLAERAPRHAPQVPRPAVHPAALVLAPADHGRGPGVRLSGQFDPRTDLRLAEHRLRHPALHRLRPTPRARSGGLIEVGRRIHEHIRAALEMGELCSNDPVCAQHDPQNPHERRFLHGAACHGCLLIAETSCEQHNDFLDRALVVPTVDNLGVEFFKPCNAMTEQLLQLADSDLRELAAALRADRLAAPFTADEPAAAARQLALPAPWPANYSSWPTRGSRRTSWRPCWNCSRRDRSQRPTLEDAIDLVTTGPEAAGRDEPRHQRRGAGAFRPCRAIGAGRRLRRLPGAGRLPRRWPTGCRSVPRTQRPDVPGRAARPGRHLDGQRSRQAVRRAVQDPASGRRTGRCPRSSTTLGPWTWTADKRACLHAKCVVVDGEAVFISSANFTEAAQERNIEIGLLVRSRWLADRVVLHFDTLLAASLLMPVL